MNSLKGFAFYDLDATLISVNSMISFLKYYYMNSRIVPFENRADAFDRTLARFNRDISLGKDRYHLYREYYLLYAGASRNEVHSLAYSWWKTQMESEHTFINETHTTLIKHKKNGLGIALVSGSLLEVVEPVAETVGAEFVAATEIVSSFETFTGTVKGEAMLGKGKARAVVKLMEDYGIQPSSCFAYGDHITDLNMLEAVGNPCVVTGDAELEAIARKRNWPTITPHTMETAHNHV